MSSKGEPCCIGSVFLIDYMMALCKPTYETDIIASGISGEQLYGGVLVLVLRPFIRFPDQQSVHGLVAL